MNCLFLAIKNIFKSKIITVISILLITVAIVLFNSTFSSIRGMFAELNFAQGFNDKNFYAVEPNYDYYDSFQRKLDENESYEYDHTILDGYCKEMGLNIERDSNEYYALLSEYDCIIRWAGQHREELGEKTLYPVYNKFEDILRNSEFEYKTERTYSMRLAPYELNGYSGFSVEIFDDEIAERINMNIIYGKDLKDTKSYGDVIEAVALGTGTFSNDIKIGDSFPITYFNFGTNEYETKTIKIVGIMGSPFYDFSGYSSFVSDNEVKLNKLVSRQTVNTDMNVHAFRFYIKPFDGIKDNPEIYHAGYNTTYYFTLNNTSDDELNNLKRELVTAGYDFTSVKIAYDNTFNEVKNTVLEDCVILFISVFLSLITICGTIILYISDNIRTHYIFMLCGAKLNDHIMVCIINVLINCIISVGLSAMYLHIQNIKRMQSFGEIGDLFGITYDRYNIYLTLLLIIIILIVTWAVSSNMFRFKMYKGRENTK